MRLLHVCCGSVIVAGQCNLVGSAVIYKKATMRLCKFSLQVVGASHLLLKLLLAPALFTGVVNARLLNVLPLPLPGRVVHQRDQGQAFMTLKRFKQCNGVGCGQFTAHMQMMVGAQQPLPSTVVNRVQYITPGTPPQAFSVGLADA